ncbi:MAG: Pyrophosphate--fructose 6-phosphate 1-phosphotransferase [Verrucomicrobia subdivision 3 bacterium]|nr:Pyrophosphate--fructose 6-phosphate 1-phosphotransferase [Limisphaerales bacterium]MCS1414534.1 Pyrophosphate--fructose 6-phosphate 1-phosphotransferase [Limisphaerales bacterium]
MSLLEGNLLVAQSGGPTAVINASVAGVIQEAGKHTQIGEIYAGRNGILGILDEDLFDLNEEMARSIEALKHTPAAALGTCRYKINFKQAPEQAAKDMGRLFEVFQAHDIRFFFYAGGNDSQDTSHKIHEEAVRRGYEMRVIGVPKTIDNDLPHTDHTPGYGSVIKYNAVSTMEVGADVGSMATDDGACCVLEVMGRSAGWIAAGTVLAKRAPSDPPHIILFPEIPFQEDAFLDRVKQVVAENKYCIIVVGEGLKNESGEEIAADKGRLDAFGHPVLSGAAHRLAEIIQGRINLKTRTVKFGYAQRAAAHYASTTDMDEAVACGNAAVRAAIEGKSGYMVKIVRTGNVPYTWKTDLHPLAEIANVEHFIPRDWIEEDGFLPNQKFIEYARPLIKGDNPVPTLGGLPNFVQLKKVPVEKKLPTRQ